jgi:putative aldouronate transport system substrate-binding protein
MNKKVPISVLTVTALSLALLSACTNEKAEQGQTAGASPKAAPNNLNATGFPIVKEPLTLSAMVLLSPSQPTNWNDILVWKEYEKKTGIHIDWQAHTSADITEKRNLALASNQLPDIFYRTKTPDSDVDKYGAEGSFIKLNGLIDQYAPNFKAIMEKYSDVKKGLQTADGSIYSLP